MDVAKMVNELKAGRVEYRADRFGICRCEINRLLLRSATTRTMAHFSEIIRVKPPALRVARQDRCYFLYMGPGIRLISQGS